MLVGDMSSRTSPSALPQAQNSAMSTPEKIQCPDNGKITYLRLYICLVVALDLVRAE